MPDERLLIVDLETGKTRPGVPRTPVLSSAVASWQGVFLEEHDSGPNELLDVAPQHHVIGLQFDPAVIELKNGQQGFRTVRLQPNHVAIFPAMGPFSLRATDTGRFLAVTLEPKFLFCAAHELASSDQFELTPNVPLEDSMLQAGLLALKHEAETGSPGGRLYAESVATALAVHLARHYSIHKPELRIRSGGLAPGQLRRAVDFIQEQLAENISLNALAAAVGLSPFHFARSFKKSVGLTPHQYVIRCRIERARQLLLRADASVSDIASRVGFCDQSHLTAHFKRLYGVTPKAFVRQTRRK